MFSPIDEARSNSFSVNLKWKLISFNYKKLYFILHSEIIISYHHFVNFSILAICLFSLFCWVLWSYLILDWNNCREPWSWSHNELCILLRTWTLKKNSEHFIPSLGVLISDKKWVNQRQHRRIKPYFLQRACFLSETLNSLE